MYIKFVVGFFCFIGVLQLVLCQRIDLGKLTCQSTGKYLIDDKMRLTYRKCPINSSVSVNYASLDPNNSRDMWKMGSVYAERYKCIFKLYGVIRSDGTFSRNAAARYASAFNPQAISTYIRRNVADCISEFHTLSRSRVTACNVDQIWIQFSSCMYSVEMKGCTKNNRVQENESYEYGDSDDGDN